MKRHVFTLFSILLVAGGSGYAFAEGLEGDWPIGGGPITITTTDGPIEAGGLDFMASGPYLSNTDQPAPWAFYITGNDKEAATQVTLGSLGSAPTIDGSLTLDVSVSGEARRGDITATWGRGTEPVAFCVGCVPEPSGATLAAFPLLFLFSLRRRRK